MLCNTSEQSIWRGDMTEGRIFISYRRGVDSHVTGRLYDRLRQSFGPERLFMDVDSIPPGVDFVDHLDRQVGQCRAFLAVVGPGWIQTLDRLHNPADFVRIEIEAVLKRPDIPIIPVLVDDTKMPRAEELPDALQQFVRRAGIALPHDHFSAIVDGRLTKTLHQALAPPQVAEPPVEQPPAIDPTPDGDSAPSSTRAREAQQPKSERRWGLIAVAIPVVIGAAFLYNRFSQETVLLEPLPAGATDPRPPVQTQTPLEEAALLLKPSQLKTMPASATLSREPVQTKPLPVVEMLPREPMTISGPTVLTSLASDKRVTISQLKHGDRFRDCPRCPELVVIPAGSFMMGSPADEKGRNSANNEGPQRKVDIKAFAMAKTEVTFDQWQACVDEDGCKAKTEDEGWGRGDRPVIYINWQDAQDYVTWLNTKVEGDPYRLPSEAEWEYAARAGDTGRFSDNKDEMNLCDIANHADASYTTRKLNPKCTDKFGGKTAPVENFQPNGFGLFDMHGNVWEWVEDVYVGNYSKAPTDGSAVVPAKIGPNAQRVMRGGSFWDEPRKLRSAHRGPWPPGDSDETTGFRPARMLSVQ